MAMYLMTLFRQKKTIELWHSMINSGVVCLSMETFDNAAEIC